MVYPIEGIYPRENKQWQLGQDTISRYRDRGDLVVVDHKPFIKMRPGDEREDVTKPFWGLFGKEIGTTESAKKELSDLLGPHGFDTVKPVELLKRLVFHTTSGDDMVLDFFAGSGSTAHAVMAQNAIDGGTRKWIAVQLPEPTVEGSTAYNAGYRTVAQLARKRIALAGERIPQDYTDELIDRADPFDAGYRSYTLTDTNFSKWEVKSDIDKAGLQQRLLALRDSSDDAATPESLLTELLLKQGHSLTESITEREIAGLRVFVVGDDLVLAYLNEQLKPTMEQLRSLVEAEPARILILEDAFQGDDELKTNLVQMCKTNDIELWTA